MKPYRGKDEGMKIHLCLISLRLCREKSKYTCTGRLFRDCLVFIKQRKVFFNLGGTDT